MTVYDNPLFSLLGQEEKEEVFPDAEESIRSYGKGDVVFHVGDDASAIGFVISGFANIEFVDYLGFRHILGSVGAGDIFAESYVLTGNELTVSVVSSTESKIALIPWKGVMERAGDEVKGKILFSLTQILAHKNRLLSSRIFITSEKSIRDKVLAFLSYQSLINSSLSFSIPFDREELSSYLGVDRSALSRELGKMRNEGLLEYRKNHFTLKADGNVFSKSE